jgi:hypothetical protein
METNRFAGSPADMGMQQGNAFKTALRDGLNPIRIELKNMPIREFLDLASKLGLGHHWIIGYGQQLVDEIVKLFNWLGIEVVRPPA